MTNYVFIESRDPFESRDVRFVEETAAALKQRGHEKSIQSAPLLPRTASACRISATPEHLSYCEVNPLNSIRNDLYLCTRKCVHALGAVDEPGVADTRLQQRNQRNDRGA